MAGRKCDVITLAGTQCKNWSVTGSAYCLAHNPDMAEMRALASKKGGQNKANDIRVLKRVPSDIRSTLDTLFRTLQGLDGGTIEPQQANAIANVSRAICSAWETGPIEAKLIELEAKIVAKASAA